MDILAALQKRSRDLAARAGWEHPEPPPRAEMARIAIAPRPAAARVLVQGVPVRHVEQPTRRTAAEQARYDREQAENTRHVVAEATAMAAYYARGEAYLARQEAETAERTDRQFAEAVLRAGAAGRGEKFSTKGWIAPPTQAARTVTAAEIIAAGEKRRNL